jgi:predicted metal-dependent hydrolase
MSRSTTATAEPYADEAIAIKPRDVHFEWDDVPMHYVRDEPLLTHLFNTMHLTLPEGERAMSKALSDALPLVEDERLREEMVGFIGQENVHAGAHEGIHEHLEDLGLPIDPVVSKLAWLVDKIMNKDHGLRGRAKHQWLCERLALSAALEHYTAVMGQWMLDADHFEDLMHPMMLDLCRWHAAEEVEHRNVAFDAFMYVDGGYGRRVRTALLASALLMVVFTLSTGYLYANDPTPGKSRRGWPRQLFSAMRRKIMPTGAHFITEIPVYLRPGFHPSQMGSIDKALRYLAQSPGAQGGAAAH